MYRQWDSTLVKYLEKGVYKIWNTVRHLTPVSSD
jgi:hypothetical protein